MSSTAFGFIKWLICRATTVSNVPSAAAPPSSTANIPAGNGGAPPGGPVYQDLPDVPGGGGVIPASGSAGAPVTPKPTAVVETHHDKSGRKSPGLLEKLKGSGGSEKIKTTATSPPPGGSTVANIPAGPPITNELPTPGKGTRFSDTAQVIPTITQQDLVEHEVAAAPASSDPKSSNKLKKKPDVVTTPGMPPPGTVLGDGMTAPLVPPSRPGSVAPGGLGASPAAPGAAVPIPPAKQAEIPILHEILLPDGTKAYIRRGPAPATTSAALPGPAAVSMPSASPATLSKKDKQKEKVDNSADIGASSQTHIPAESEMGKGHCMMCCPTAPRDASGRLIYPCAHQDGLAGPSAMDRAQAAAGHDKGKKKAASPPPVVAADIPLPPGGETVVVEASEKPAPNKLVKGGKAGPSGVSPEEMAMDDARKLAGE